MWLDASISVQNAAKSLATGASAPDPAGGAYIYHWWNPWHITQNHCTRCFHFCQKYTKIVGRWAPLDPLASWAPQPQSAPDSTRRLDVFKSNSSSPWDPIRTTVAHWRAIERPGWQRTGLFALFSSWRYTTFRLWKSLKCLRIRISIVLQRYLHDDGFILPLKPETMEQKLKGWCHGCSNRRTTRKAINWLSQTIQMITNAKIIK